MQDGFVAPYCSAISNRDSTGVAETQLDECEAARHLDELRSDAVGQV